MELRPADFADFFRAIHHCDPFPWQQTLVHRLADSDTWPDVLELPTGSGKTAALDAAVFHLALRADTPDKAAFRIALVVDRRLVVDDAFARAEKITESLRRSLDENGERCAVVEEVARRLQGLAGNSAPPLVAQRLRGGAPLEHDWARTPTQPTILCSTVEQVGSRLLFRGYGVSDRMKPIHAGLLGVGSLILLDEAHLAEPFRQTLDAVCTLGRAKVKVALLSATPGRTAQHQLTLSPEDRNDLRLRKRIEARKPAALKDGVKNAIEAFADEARKMADRLRERGFSPAAVGVVVNRVALARKIFDALDGDNTTDTVLMIGRSRSVDRNAIADTLAPFRTGETNRGQAKPLFVVATQCLEVGVDLDLDGLVTQAASLDALRQRFGRLNRDGRPVDAEGAIIALEKDIAKKADDPVYGDRIRLTWEALKTIAGDVKVIDFGVDALPKQLRDADIDPDNLASKRPNAPVLMPAYLDLWAQTSPRPVADPTVELFLHGAKRTAAGVSIVWRGDISANDLEDKTDVDLKELIRMVPPRTAEAVELPLWVARKWLRSGTRSDDISDAPECEVEGAPEREAMTHWLARKAFRWAGHDDPDTNVVSANDLRTGDLLVVPAEYGGCDSFGWAPESGSPVTDVADEAVKPYWGQRCAVRVAPDIVRKEHWHRISDVLVSEGTGGPELVERLLSVLSSEAADDGTGDGPTLRDVRGPLKALRLAKGRVDVRFPYAGGREGGAIIIAERGIGETTASYSAPPTTEDEAASHTSSRPVPLDDHGCRVARFAKDFCRTLGLDDDVAADLRLAAYLHDAGKADPRFQTMLAGGDPWNRPDGPPLAKGGRSWAPQAWERAGLPRGWRHEALSVRMARAHPHLAKACNRDLVLWLIGTHHGLGRPFFNFLDPEPEQDLPSCLDITDWRVPAEQPGPQSLAFDLDGTDWPFLFEDLKRRYGIWGLAHLEAVLRLADHRASEEERAS